MSILHPGLAAAALASVLVPILIHLLLRRRKRVMQWAAMDLLQRAMRRDRRRQRVERWMLLVARCLLLALAGLAIAQPLLGGAGGLAQPMRTLWVVIDDGATSAERLASGGTVLDRSVDEARRAIATIGPGDRIGVITASEPVRRAIDPPTADGARVESFLASLEPSFTGSDLGQALREAATAARDDEGTTTEVLLLSSFRRGSLDLSMTPPALEGTWPTGAKLAVMAPLLVSSSNAWISEIEALRRGDDAGSDGDRPLRVRVERGGSTLPRDARRVTVAGGGGAADLTLDAGERRASVDLRLRSEQAPTAAPAPIEVILDADAQPRDDQRFALLPSEQAPRVLVLDRRSFSGRADLERLSSGAWMARAVAPSVGGKMQVDEIDPGSLDRAMLGRAEVVIAARPDLLVADGWSMLRDFVDGGGSLIVTPAPEEIGQRWVERFRTALVPTWRIDAEVEHKDDVWRLAPEQPPSATLRMLGSELSILSAPVTVSRRLRARAPAADAESALLFDDGEPLLLAGRSSTQHGWVMLLTAAPELEWTDLPVRPLMVPLMQELVRQGRRLARGEETAYTGVQVTAPRGAVMLVPRDAALGSTANPAGVSGATSPGRGGSITVGIDGRTREPVVRPGVYDALDESGRTLGAIAVNVDHRRTNIEPNAPAAVDAWLRASGSWTVLGDANEGQRDAIATTARAEGSWSLVLLIIAAFVALMELILARILSRSATAGSAR